MKKISVSLPDGSALDFHAGVLGEAVVQKIGPGLARAAIALKVDNQAIFDLHTPIEQDCSIKVLTEKDPEALDVLRHSSAHIMSEAVQALFKGVKVTIGPATETGFYYDYEYKNGFTEEDLKKIENKMAAIIKEKRPFVRCVVDKKEAIQKFKKMKETYKVEIINDLPDKEPISIYQQGKWEDLCRGPHIPHTGWVKAFKLLSIAGAYWRGDEKNQTLQRIYGTSFYSKKDLDAFLTQQEEAKKRDHRKLGKQLDLFSFHLEAPANPFFHPKGERLYATLIDYWKQAHAQAEYQLVKTPFILNDELWKQSGHYEHYKENMYFVKIDEGDYAVKPMNCPGHILIYKTKRHSYRDLPLRMAELGLVHRHELSGVTHGLMRTRVFTIDDAHIFCTQEQIESEVVSVIDLLKEMYKAFGFTEIKVGLSTKPKESIGEEAIWKTAEDALEQAIQKSKLDYRINKGDGAFYGPKIDFEIKDSIGRMWQCGTIQLDFQMPERFELSYTGSDGSKHRPVMIHRAIFGSVERFLGVLIEQYAGAFPTWLAPVQATIINVTDSQLSYSNEIYAQCLKQGVRIEKDLRNEKLGYKIREAQVQKIPYMIIIGDKEVQSKTVSVRLRNGKNLSPMSVGQFIERILNETSQKI